ncbi:hypothetical protein [Bacillus massiliglaciei]|uniref:hypothetical protein n=1 Tax=Bacillus massiliglaciei TaxID=1816693 RepID=UPI000DA6035C|nr:hypothetical protein [Bacillus massiliglaciei]
MVNLLIKTKIRGKINDRVWVTLSTNGETCFFVEKYFWNTLFLGSYLRVKNAGQNKTGHCGCKRVTFLSFETMGKIRYDGNGIHHLIEV